MKLCVSILTLLFFSEVALASQWEDLWLRPDQQGQKLLKQQKYQEAAERFQDPKWQAVAQYRAGHFADAAQKFSQDNSARGRYNYANALAQQGQFAEAIQLYNQALKLQPNFADAEFNKKLLEEAMKKQSEQQQQNQQKNQNQKSQSNQSQQSENTKKDEQNSADQQNSSNSGREKEGSDPSATQGGQTPQPDPAASAKAMEAKGSDPINPSATSAEEAGKNEKEKAEQRGLPSQLGDNADQAHNESSKQAQEKADLQQWLQKIPDDPAGLLRRKFMRDHQRRRWDQQG